MKETLEIDIPDYLFFLIILVAVGIGMSNLFTSHIVAFLAGCIIALTWSAYKRIQSI